MKCYTIMKKALSGKFLNSPMLKFISNANFMRKYITKQHRFSCSNEKLGQVVIKLSFDPFSKSKQISLQETACVDLGQRGYVVAN